MCYRLKFYMLDILFIAFAVQNYLFADNAYDFGGKFCGQFFRIVGGGHIGVLQDGDFNKFSCVERLGKTFDHIVGHAGLAYLTDGFDAACQRF